MVTVPKKLSSLSKRFWRQRGLTAEYLQKVPGPLLLCTEGRAGWTLASPGNHLEPEQSCLCVQGTLSQAGEEKGVTELLWGWLADRRWAPLTPPEECGQSARCRGKRPRPGREEIRSRVTLSRSLPSLGRSCLHGTSEGRGGQWPRAKPGVLLTQFDSWL